MAKSAVVEAIEANPNPTVVEGAMALVDKPMDPNEAMKYDEVIRGYADKARFRWYSLGEAVKVIRDQELWKSFSPNFGEDPFAGLDDYLDRRLERAKSTAYLAMKLRVALEDIPAEDCQQIPQQNAIWLAKYITRVENKPPKAMIDKAKTMKEALFADYVNVKMPGAAKEEVKQNITFSKCDKSLAKVVDKALVVAMWDAEVDDKRDALERICSHYLQSLCEHEGFKKMSNEEAFNKSKGKKHTEKKPN